METIIKKSLHLKLPVLVECGLVFFSSNQLVGFFYQQNILKNQLISINIEIIIKGKQHLGLSIFARDGQLSFLLNWIEVFIKIIEFFGKDQLVSSFLAWTLSSREVWMTLLLSYQVLICFSTWRVYISFFSYNFRFDTKKQVCQMNTARLLHKGNLLYPFLRNSISENQIFWEMAGNKPSFKNLFKEAFSLLKSATVFSQLIEMTTGIFHRF